MTNQQELALLASEFWKIVQALVRCSAIVPEAAKPRIVAQATYAEEKLKSLLDRNGMRIVLFDGIPFEVNLPAIAVNGSDFRPDERAVVERTLEPAIVTDSGVLLTGRVFLTSAAN
jgi:hypothetical protein